MTYEVIICGTALSAKWIRLAGSWDRKKARGEATRHRRMGFKAMVVPTGTFAENKVHGRNCA